MAPGRATRRRRLGKHGLRLAAKARPTLTISRGRTHRPSGRSAANFRKRIMGRVATAGLGSLPPFAEPWQPTSPPRLDHPAQPRLPIASHRFCLLAADPPTPAPRPRRREHRRAECEQRLGTGQTEQLILGLKILLQFINGSAAAGPIFASANAVATRTSSSLSCNKGISAGVASAAAGPMLPSARTMSRRRGVPASPSNSSTVGTAPAAGVLDAAENRSARS